MVKLSKTAMKRAGVVLAVAALVSGAGALVVRQNEQYQTNKQAEETAAAKQEATEDQKAQATEAKLARVLDQYQKTRLECEKGHGWYPRLTTFTRTQVSAPGSCGPAVIN